MKKKDLAYRIYEIDQDLKGLEDEKRELREELLGKMKTGEVLVFDTPEGTYKAKACETNVKILRKNAEILEEIGLQGYLAASTVLCGKLETYLKAAGDVGGTMARCIEAVETKTVLKILRGN